MVAAAGTSSKESERPMEALRGDVVTEKKSAGNAIASEQLKRKKKKEKRNVLREDAFKKWTYELESKSWWNRVDSSTPLSASKQTANTKGTLNKLWGSQH